MILNMYTYRTIKNALSLIPGAPGSAQLGELMAAAWDFRSFHALSLALQEVDEYLSNIPERADVNPELMIRRCAEMGIDHEVARSLALTMFLVQDADFAVEMMEEYEELRGARAYRFDQTTQQWRDTVRGAMSILSTAAPGRAWVLPLSGEIDWRHPVEASETLAKAMRVIEHDPLEDPDMLESRPYGDEEFDLTDQAAARGGYLPVTIAENVLGMCQNVLPDGMKALLLGPRGVVALYAQFEICLVEYDHRDLHLHAPIMTLEGPEMI